MGRVRSESDVVLYVIDDNVLVGDALCRLAAAVGFEARPFASIRDFAAQPMPSCKGCVLLDSSQLKAGRDAGWPALGWQRALPVIVLCGSTDDKARSAARSFGARFFLNKPVDAQALFDAIAWVTEEMS